MYTNNVIFLYTIVIILIIVIIKIKIIIKELICNTRY